MKHPVTLLLGALALAACAMFAPGAPAFAAAQAQCEASPDVQAAAARLGVPAAELCDLVLRAATKAGSSAAEAGGLPVAADGGTCDEASCPWPRGDR